MKERLTQILLTVVATLLLITLLKPLVLESWAQSPLAKRALPPTSHFAASEHNIYVLRGNVLSVYWIDSGSVNPFEGLAMLDPQKKEAFIEKMKQNANVRLLIEQDLSEVRPEK